MKKVITADHAVAIGAKLSRVEVIAAYPITPQTLIIEHLSDFVSDGELDAKFLPVESEHSAMSACIASEAAGTRSFTATSSQGLALMHEMLYSAAPLRLPIVMVNVNRTLASPPGIWCEYNDSMAERESGWIQMYVEDNQEALDMVIQAYKIAEDKRVLLPVMPCMDGFVLSHTVEPVEVPDQETVDGFLPGYDPMVILDPSDPMIVGSFMPSEYIMEMRRQTDDTMEASKKIIGEANREFSRALGRDYGGLIQTYQVEDAEAALITLGTVTSTAREVVDEYRSRGEKVGLVKLRFMRPFPREELRELAEKVDALGVFDRSISYSEGGPVFHETKAAIYGMPAPLPEEVDAEAIDIARARRCGLGIPIINHLAGIGGRDVDVRQIRRMFDITLKAARGERVSPVYWHDTRGVP